MWAWLQYPLQGLWKAQEASRGLSSPLGGFRW